jgi:hypothetical protein
MLWRLDIAKLAGSSFRWEEGALEHDSRLGQ